MKGIRYKIKAYESILEFSHGWYKIIEEIFIPKKMIAFNFYGDKLNIFKTGEERYEEALYKEDIEIEEEDVNLLKRYIKLKEKCEASFKKYFVEE